jgi:hypothetical protein
MSNGKDQLIDPLTLLDEQVKLLEQAAPFSIDPCVVAKLIAIKDSTVRDKLVDRLSKPQVYEPRGVECLEPDILFNQRVLFRFVCRPPVFCLVDPSFLAIVNLTTHRVEVQDPYVPVYFPTSKCSCGPRARATTYADEQDSRDAIGELAEIISSVLAQPVTCALVQGRDQCRNFPRCDAAFAKLRNFHENPSAQSARSLADWIGASSMNENCMKAIIRTAGTVEYAIFLAAIIAAAAA